MPTASEELLDASVRHQVYLQRYSTATVRKIIALLNAVDDDLVDKIKKYDPTAVTGSYSRKRLEKLLEAVWAINKDAYARVKTTLDGELKDLAAYEAGFQARMIDNAVPIALDIVQPSASQLYAAVNARPFQGRLLKEWYSGLEDAAQRRLRDAIRMGFVEGETIDQMVRRVRGTRANQYRDGVLEMSRRGAQAMVRTAVNHTASVARNELYKANSGVIKSVRWVSTLDARTTAICQARDGKVYPVDSGPRPPAHWNCLPGDALVTSRYGITGASKRWYDGQLVVVSTSAGKNLACTPNHPILTDTGWVAAHLLKVGDNVVCDSGSEWDSAALDMDHENVPTAIEEVAETTFRALKMRTRPVPSTAKDFHGDGMDGEIAIVASDCFLEDGLEPTLFEQRSNSALVVRDTDLPMLTRDGHLAPLFFAMRHATNSVVRSLREFATLLRSGTVHAGLLLFGSVAKFDALIAQYPFNRTGRALEMVGYSSNADAGLIHLHDFIGRKVNTRLPGTGAERFATLGKPSENGVDADAKLASDILCGATGPVFLSNIVGIERRYFSGHVFNLETEKGFYVANGIVTHNCRSTTTPVLKSWKELGINLKEAQEGTRASLSGQVPSSMTYDEWLRKQPKAVQEDVLGVTKAKLYRDGDLSVDRFVDRAGHELTLDELRRKEADAFERAGIDR